MKIYNIIRIPKKLLRAIFIGFWISFLIPFQSYAQNDCSSKLSEATDMYNQGLYQQALKILLESVDKCDYSKSEFEQAEKLIIGSYFELDELEKGTEYTIKFLKNNPNYNINKSSDPQLFIKEVETFEINPKYKISANFGVNKLSAIVLNRNSVWEVADYSLPYIEKLNTSFQIGVEAVLAGNLSMKLGLVYSSHKYERRIPAYTNFLLDYSESFKEIKIPEEIKYSFNINKNWTPVIIAGFYYSKILNPSANIYVTDTDPVTGSKFEKAEKGISTKEFRTLNNYGYLYGASINYSFNRIILSFETVLNSDIKEFVVNKSDIIEHEPTIDYFYIDDNFKLRDLEFRVGIAYTFLYQIRKKY